MVCSIGRARVREDDNVKRDTKNVEQRVALIRDGFLISCAHLCIEAHLSGASPPTHVRVNGMHKRKTRHKDPPNFARL